MLQIVQIASYPVIFGVERAPAIMGSRMFFFTCESTCVLGLLAVLRSLVRVPTSFEPKHRILHQLLLIEDGTFGLYCAKFGERQLCLKLLSSMYFILYMFVVI